MVPIQEPFPIARSKSSAGGTEAPLWPCMNSMGLLCSAPQDNFSPSSKGETAAQEDADGGWWWCWEVPPIRTGPGGVHLTVRMPCCSLSTAFLHLGLWQLLLGVLTSSFCSTRWPRPASSSSGGPDTGLAVSVATAQGAGCRAICSKSQPHPRVFTQQQNQLGSG